LFVSLAQNIGTVGTRIAVNSAPVVGMIPSRGFPREIRATADGHTLLVTNFSAGTLQIVDLRRSPWDFAVNNVQQLSWVTRAPLESGRIDLGHL
jgi:hypothetical protein